MRSISIHVDRQSGIRAIAEAMRQKQADFSESKKAHRVALANGKKSAIDHLKKSLAAMRSAKSGRDARSLFDKPDYYKLNEWFPSEPTLNLCELKRMLVMFQNDKRDSIPVHSSHELWAILQGKCDVIK